MLLVFTFIFYLFSYFVPYVRVQILVLSTDGRSKMLLVAIDYFFIKKNILMKSSTYLKFKCLLSFLLPFVFNLLLIV